jgi:Bacterial regulatory helix-turn-helix protein, lysR family
MSEFAAFRAFVPGSEQGCFAAAARKLGMPTATLTEAIGRLETVLSVQEEAIIVVLRKHTLLPLDDGLYALQPTIPHLTRSALHRCLQRAYAGMTVLRCSLSILEPASRSAAQPRDDRS